VPPDSTPAPLNLAALIAEGYTAPRQSMARVLALRPDEPMRLMMVGIGIVVGALGFAALGERTAEAGQGGVVFGYVLTVIAGLLQYYIFALITGTVSRAMGGQGDREADRTLVAWWALVTAPLPVVMVLAVGAGQSPVAVLVLFGAAILSLVLLAAYITEAHGFTSTARVCGAILMLIMIFSFVVTSLLPSFMPMPA